MSPYKKAHTLITRAKRWGLVFNLDGVGEVGDLNALWEIGVDNRNPTDMECELYRAYETKTEVSRDPIEADTRKD